MIRFQIPHGVCRAFSDIKFKIARIFFPFKPYQTLYYLTVTDKTNKILLFTQNPHLCCLYARRTAFDDGNSDKKVKGISAVTKT